MNHTTVKLLKLVRNVKWAIYHYSVTAWYHVDLVREVNENNQNGFYKTKRFFINPIERILWKYTLILPWVLWPVETYQLKYGPVEVFDEKF